MAADLEKMFSGKSSEALAVMLDDIVKGGPSRVGGDVDYWENMINNVTVMKVRSLPRCQAVNITR
jgi:hypothetical protein